MGQQPLEMILTRQLAGYLGVPIFLVDPHGTLLFYNESAEPILGTRFNETGPIPAQEWASTFTATDKSGCPLPSGQLPLMIAVEEHRPAHRQMSILGLDGVERTIDFIAFPIIGIRGDVLGAMALFWEVPS